jgi:hypothetical protein
MSQVDLKQSSNDLFSSSNHSETRVILIDDNLELAKDLIQKAKPLLQVADKSNTRVVLIYIHPAFEHPPGNIIPYFALWLNEHGPDHDILERGRHHQTETASNHVRVIARSLIHDGIHVEGVLVLDAVLDLQKVLDQFNPDLIFIAKKFRHQLPDFSKVMPDAGLVYL